MKWRSALIGLAVSAISLYLSFRQVDPASMWEAFRQAEPGWLALSLVTVAVALVLRCVKWQIMLLPQDRVTFEGAFASTMIGYLFNALLPGRVGEVARAALVSQTDHVAAVRAFGTIFLEKLIDVLVLVVILACLIGLTPLPEWAARTAAGAAAVFGSVAAVFVVLRARRQRFVGWVKRHLDPLPLLRPLAPSRLVDVLLSAADSLAYPRLFLWQALLTGLMWIAALLTIVTLAQAFHLGVPLLVSALILVGTNLGMTVPAAPAALGVYHGIVVAILLWAGVDKSLALSFAVVLHAEGFGTMILVGAAMLLRGIARQQYTLSSLWHWRQRDAGTVSLGDAGAMGATSA